MTRPRRAWSLALPLLAALASCAADPGSEPAVPPAPDPPPDGAPAAPQPPSAVGLSYPSAPPGPVVDEYHGVKVADPYRWLEAWDEPVQRWTDAQSRLARAEIDRTPGIDALRRRVTELKSGNGASFFSLSRRKTKLFALQLAPPKQQPLLVTLPGADDPKAAKALLDPNALDPSGHTAIDFYVPSLDGKLVAVSLSRGGTESGDVHVYEADTGKEVGEVIPRVNGGTASGSLAWDQTGKGFFYTRYPKEGERPAADLPFYQQLYHHTLGKKVEEDRYAIGKEFPRIAEIEVGSRPDGKYTLLRVENGDGEEFVHYLLGPGGSGQGGETWVKFADYADKIAAATFGPDERIYLLSRKGAPRGKILRISAGTPDLAKAEAFLPESEATLRSVVLSANRLYSIEMVGGPSRVRVFDLKGKELPPVPLPPASRVGQVIWTGVGDEVLLNVQSFIEPPAWYRYDGAGKLVKTGLVMTSPADYSDAEVLREACASKDGTQVPISLIQRKGTPRDGARPTILYGYGGYGVVLAPRFDEDMRVLLDQGGVFAVANIRGGGELGDAWHDGGKLTRKQNAFDDFAGCARHLIEGKVTRPERLAFLGRSNGGLLMGAMITQHPELARAVVAQVGLFDMLRVETDANGEFNTTEFGTVKVPEQFKALHAYSPYHHVTPGTQYPAVLLTTGMNDPRVAPWQARKMAARLQATGSKSPVLLLTRAGGHGVGGSLQEKIDDTVDMYAFVFAALGVELKQGK